jgi:hypothetical protein
MTKKKAFTMEGSNIYKTLPIQFMLKKLKLLLGFLNFEIMVQN